MRPVSGIIAIAVLLSPLSQARGLLPAYWIENVEGTDGSIQQSLVFQTTKGVGYTVEWSDNLSSWNPDQSLDGEGGVYGLSQQCVVPIREFTPPPPSAPPPGITYAPPIRRIVGLALRRSSGPEGGTIAIWPSLSGSGTASALLPVEMSVEWNTVVFSWHSYGPYGIHAYNFGQTALPAVVSASISPEDAAFLTVLQSSFPEMNQRVELLQAFARNTPPPPPLPPDSKRFWRIKADWSVDSDADGSPDWAEFEMADDPSHPSHPLADPFNRDVDNNQTLDGIQLDLDRDGTEDITDPVPNNPQLSQPVIPIPRYALFPVSPASPLPERKAALQINDRGTVLYVNGTWSGGSWQELTASGAGLTECKAVGINDSDEIIGWGIHELQADPSVLRPVVTHWASPTAGPAAVRMDATFATPYFDFQNGSLTPGPVISNDGRVIAPTAERKVPEGHDNPDLVPIDGGKRSVWVLPGPGRTVARTLTEGGMTHILSETCHWGYDPITGDGIYRAPGSPASTTTIANNVVIIDNKLFAFGKRQGDLNWVHSQGSWKSAAPLSSAIDMADDGTAISRDSQGVAAPIFVNGRDTPAAKMTPQVPDVWKDGSVKLIDTTPGGWILAQRGGDQPPEYAALLPLRVEGNLERDGDGVIHREAVGVDNYSIASTAPGEAVKDRIWIMTPAGTGETRVKLTTPIHGTTPLRISGAGLKFNGDNDSVEITSKVTEFTIKAADGIESGSEIPLTLKLGTAQAQSASLPIAAKVMKRRTVKVTLWRVASDGYPGSPSEMPRFNPDTAAVKQYLDRTFGPQINALFEIQSQDISIPIDFDSGDGQGFGAPADKLQPKNQNLDLTEDLEGDELSKLKAGGYHSLKNINIYLLGGIKVVTCYRWDAASGKMVNQLATNPDGSGGADGIALEDQRIVLIPAGFTTPQSEGLHTIAHEVGHIIFGPGHPDSEGGRAPLPGAPNRPRRLMYGEPNFRLTDGSARLAVKAEWDAAKTWCDQEIGADPQRMEP